MKKLSLLNLVLVCCLALGVMTFASCESDPCEDVTCVNGTAVASGDNCNCDCDAGYEGDDCTTLSRTKFVGTYTVADACSESGAGTYTVTITASSTEVDKVLISNFWGAYSNNVIATVDGNTLTIANQDPDSDGYPVSGTGTYSATNNTITVNYTVTETASGDTDVCQATYTKQ